MRREIIEWAKAIVISLISALIITTFVKPTVVQQDSMQNTLENNDFLILSRLLYKLNKPEGGDIIVFKLNQKSSKDKSKLLIKRVIAIPGDEITISDGKVIKNGEILNEAYIKTDYTEGNINLIIPGGKIFVLGDNRGNSADSRDPDIGLIDMKDIVGKAFVRLYPFNRLGLLY
ncbi:signal peptidase I [Clostridium aceticum]|uniref:Signal peptidase I n=1 Tax=Clostridium aceticum TaxID=84022 RepID=A0A0D8I9R3_9CLOT|nr:signal peptidase I [Clostridium aceticum]AKL96037.1 signal peptidase I [Clostridium aceticum]KJF27030.1 signal peptidase [Clostridium aceticum]